MWSHRVTMRTAARMRLPAQYKQGGKRMAITYGGVRFEDKDNGLTKVGDNNVGGVGVGTLTVDGVSLLNLTSANLATVKLQALRVGDATGADGTVNIGASS